MATGPSDRQSIPRADEPLEAELVETPSLAESASARGNQARYTDRPAGPPRRSRAPLIGCGIAVVVVLLVLGGGSIALIYRGSQLLRTPGNASDFRADGPLTQERASIIANLDGTWQINPKDAKFRDVWRLLRSLEKTGADNKKEFAELVDWPSHMARYYKAYRHQPIGYQTRLQLDSMERGDFGMPAEASDFKIAAVDERSADDWYVYTYPQQGALANAPYIFHVRRRKNDWKLVDWAEVGELSWNAEHNATGAGPLVGDSARSELFSLGALIQAADTLRENQQLTESAEKLRLAEGHVGSTALRDSGLYMLALRWEALNQLEETDRVLRLISDHDAYPWAHQLLARVHHRRGEYADALAAITRYEACAGFYYDLATIKMQCQTQLEQEEQASKTALALLRYAPDNAHALSLAVQHASREQLSEIINVWPKGPERDERLVNAARMALHDDAVDRHQMLRDYLAAENPNSKHVLSLDAQLLHYQGELEQAIAILKQLVERETEPGKRSVPTQEYLSLLLELKSPLDAYQEAPHPRESLEVMTDGLAYDDEAMVSAAQLAKILPVHRERDPDDPKLPWYTAHVLIEQQDWPAAVTAITKAIESYKGDEAQAELEAELQQQLLDVRYELGQALDAYREAEDPAETYQALAARMAQSDQWEALQALNELRPQQQDDFWRRYYGLCVKEQAALESHNRTELLAVLADYQNLARDNQATQTIYPSLIEARIDALGIEGAGWRSYLRGHSEPARLFAGLATRFRREKDAAALQELLALAHEKFPDAPALQQFELERLWDAGDYAGVVAYCEAHPLKQFGAGNNYQVASERQELLLLSHLMQNHSVSAWKVASEPTPNVHQQWLVRLADGNQQEMAAFLSEHRDDLYGALTLGERAKRVPALVENLASTEFKELLKTIALPLVNDYEATQAIVFYPAPVAWTEEEIQSRLRAVDLPDAEVKELPKPSLVSNTYRIRSGGDEYLLTYSERPYVTPADMHRYTQHLEPSIKSAIADHQQWVVLNPRQVSQKGQHSTWLKFIAAFTPQASALWARAEGNEIVQTVVTPEIATRVTTKPAALENFLLPPGRYSWIPQSDADEDEEPRRWYARCRAAVQDGKLGRVQVQILSGAAIEEQWLDVVSVEHEHWGQYSITARLTEASQLNPLYAKGALVRLSQHRVRAWED